MSTSPLIETLRLDDEQDALVIIDQTLLPNEVRYLSLKTQSQIWEAIQQLRVRGAPAIGIAAAYGVYLAVKHSTANDHSTFLDEFRQASRYLASARPTAVNLFWALQRMEDVITSSAVITAGADVDIPQLVTALRQEADAILAEDIQTNQAIGENALALLQVGDGLLTHCNAGGLATARYGTATAPIYLGQERGYHFKVFADETRPLLQGARLTTFELAQAGVDVTLICDNMAATVMHNGWVQAVLVGCDRVAANGDTANKIGTLGVAVLAHEFGIPFYVCAPSSTIDLATANGQLIPIEERNPEEIYRKWYQTPMAPEQGVKFYNPAFDVTPAKYISAIISEYGIARPPFEPALRKMKEQG